MLFDIVKKDGARAMPRAAFAFARGRSHISGSCALRHRRPSASDGQAAGGLERNRFGRNQGFAPGIFLVAWSHRKPANFRDHAPAGTTAMTSADSNKKDGRRIARLRDRAHQTVSRLVTLPMDKEGDALRRGNIHVQLSIDV